MLFTFYSCYLPLTHLVSIHRIPVDFLWAKIQPLVKTSTKYFLHCQNQAAAEQKLSQLTCILLLVGINWFCVMLV